MRYPVILQPDDNDTILVTSPDMPMVSFGYDEADALRHALDAFLTLIDSMRRNGEPIPPPSAITGPYVDIPGL